MKVCSCCNDTVPENLERGQSIYCQVFNEWATVKSPVDDLPMGDPHPCDMTPEERERYFAALERSEKS